VSVCYSRFDSVNMVSNGEKSKVSSEITACFYTYCEFDAFTPNASIKNFLLNCMFTYLGSRFFHSQFVELFRLESGKVMRWG
jgi:hypothetical protein